MSAPTKSQLQALVRLWEVAQADHGGSRVCVKLLLGLYNGDRFVAVRSDLTQPAHLNLTHPSEAT